MENKSCFGKGVFACSIAEEAFDGLESNPKTSMTTKIVTIAGNIASLNSKALVVISEILNAEANFLNILDNSTLEYLIDTLTKLKSEIKDGNKDTLIKSVVNGWFENKTIAPLSLIILLYCSHKGSKGITESHLHEVVP